MVREKGRNGRGMEKAAVGGAERQMLRQERMEELEMQRRQLDLQMKAQQDQTNNAHAANACYGSTTTTTTTGNVCKVLI